MEMYKEYVENQHWMNFIATYRLSQDQKQEFNQEKKQFENKTSCSSNKISCSSTKNYNYSRFKFFFISKWSAGVKF